MPRHAFYALPLSVCAFVSRHKGYLETVAGRAAKREVERNFVEDIK